MRKIPILVLIFCLFPSLIFASGLVFSSGGATYFLSGTAAQTYTFPTTSQYLAPNPLTTIGDIPYANSTATPAAYGRIAAVAAGQPLLSGGLGTVPAYAGYYLSGTAGQTYTYPTTSKTLLANDWSNLNSSITGLYYFTSGTPTAITPPTDGYAYILGYDTTGTLNKYRTLSLYADYTPFYDAAAGTGASAKIFTFSAAGITGGTTRVFTVPDYTGTIQVAAPATTTTYALFATATEPAYRAIAAGDLPTALTPATLMATGRIDGLAGSYISTANSATSIVIATHGNSAYFLNIGDSDAHSVYTLPTPPATHAVQYMVTNDTGITTKIKMLAPASVTITLDGATGSAAGWAIMGGVLGDTINCYSHSATRYICHTGKGTAALAGP